MKTFIQWLKNHQNEPEKQNIHKVNFNEEVPPNEENVKIADEAIASADRTLKRLGY